MIACKKLNKTPHSLRQYLLASALVVLSVSSSHGATTAKPTPLELQPYRVLISVAFAQQPTISPMFRQQQLRAISDWCERSVGEMWQVQIEENNWLTPSTTEGLNRLAPDAIQTRYIDQPYDKVFLVVVDHDRIAFQLSSRVWELMNRHVGNLLTKQTRDRRAVSDQIHAMLSQLFRPEFLIEEANENNVQLKLRAGAFPAIDPAFQQVRVGEILVPYFRYYDKKKIVRRILGVPTTFLSVESVSGHHVKCRIVSGLRSPLGARRRRRVDLVAIKQKPDYSETEIQFIPFTRPTKPIVGATVKVVYKRLAKESETAEPLVKVTDRGGTIRVATHAEHPLVWLYVFGGKTLLARTPFFPGAQPAEVIRMPDDELRLAVENEIAILKGRLIDNVAQRAALLSRSKLYAQMNQWDKIEGEFAKLSKLPGLDEFERDLSSIRLPAVREAELRGDRVSALKIREMSRSASQIIQRYLDKDKVRLIRDEIEELRKMDKEDSADTKLQVVEPK